MVQKPAITARLPQSAVPITRQTPRHAAIQPRLVPLLIVQKRQVAARVKSTRNLAKSHVLISKTRLYCCIFKKKAVGQTNGLFFCFLMESVENSLNEAGYHFSGFIVKF